MKAAKIFGIDIYLDWSWFLFFGLIIFIFYQGFSQPSLGLEKKVSLIGAFMIALLIFASLLFHEICHSLMAKREGVDVKRITLMMFGGAAQLKHGSRLYENPGREFKIVIVGPLSSLFLAGIFWGLGQIFQEPKILLLILKELAFLNALWVVFNLIPAFPLDGGRIFRSAMWKISNNLLKATKIAVSASIAMCVLMVGAAAIFLGIFSAVWIGFISFLFIVPAALEEQRRLALVEKHKNTLVKELMTPMSPGTVADYQKYIEYFWGSGGKKIVICQPNDKVLDVLEEIWGKTKLPHVLVIEQDLVIGRLKLEDIFLRGGKK